MMFDYRDIENKIQGLLEYKIKNNILEINNDFCLLRVCWDNNSKIDNTIWNLMKYKLKDKIEFNYIFDFIKINNVNDNKYVINTIKKKYDVYFNTIILNNITMKELLYDDFNNYLVKQNYDLEDYDVENFDLDNYLCLFINKKCCNVYNLKHINNNNEMIMFCNILSNVINNNLV